MPLFYCVLCDQDRDSDFHGCQQSFNDECECICEDCAQAAEAEGIQRWESDQDNLYDD